MISMNETILIIDYGSQYTQLIARKIREQNVYCLVHPYNKINSKMLINKNLSGIILSGGPNSVKDKKSPKLDKKLLLMIASIISIIFSLAFMMSGLYIDGWVEVFWFVYFIGFIFIIAKYTPELVLHLKNIHLSNLEDAEEQELRKAD